MRVVVGLLVAIVAFYGLFYRGHFQTTDESCVFEAAVSLWDAGNAGISPGATNFRVPGRHGISYTMVNSGLSMAAQPFIAASRVVTGIATFFHQGGGLCRLLTPSRNSQYELDVFFVLGVDVLFVAALVVIFFRLQLRLGAGPRTAAWLSLLLGTCTHVGGFATNLFQHASEACFVLLAFHWLHEDACAPSPRSRLCAGLAACLLVQFRFPAVQAWIPLCAYHFLVLRRRRAGVREAREVVACLVLGLLIHFADQYWKFGTLRMVGDYGSATFGSPLWVSWSGFLVSPGHSVFLYTPLLLLLPWTLPAFWRSHRLEAVFVILLALTYLVGCGSFRHWAGLWCFGPRYLAATVPILLLPLGPWLERHPRGWRAAIPLALAGLLVNVVHVTVNFNGMFRGERYWACDPEYQFLFEPARSPLLTFGRALLHVDGRADFWLLNLGRAEGPTLAWCLAACFMVGIALGIAWMRAGLRLLASSVEQDAPADAVDAGRPAAGMEKVVADGVDAVRPAAGMESADVDEVDARRLAWRPRMAGLLREPVLAGLVVAWLATAIAWCLPALHRSLPWGTVPAATVEKMMDAGRACLHGSRDASAAATWFRRVVEANPGHLGAHYQLALALEAMGEDASDAWADAHRLALEQGHLRVAREIERRLQAASRR